MDLDIRFRGLRSSVALREHVSRLVFARLGRFGRNLTGVVVRIIDLNGPKGGLDKRCQITVRGPAFGATTLDVDDGNTYGAVESAIERVARAIARELERSRGVRYAPAAVRGRF